MVQDLHYCSKRLEREQSEDQNPAEQTANSHILMSDVKFSSDLQLLPTLLSVTHFSLLGWFHSLLAALFDRYPMTVASPASWCLQSNPGSHSQHCTVASLGLHSVTPLKHTCPQPTFLVMEEHYIIPFLGSKARTMWLNCQILLLTGAGACPPHLIISPLAFWLCWFPSLLKRGCPRDPFCRSGRH